VSGNASMAGLVEPTLLNLDGTARWTIMTSGTGPIDNGVAVNDTLIVDYELLFDRDGASHCRGEFRARRLE
jgi:hypothetical protein